MAPPRKPIDWDRLEIVWRQGIVGPLQMAADYTKETGVSISHTGISKHFRKLGIQRDLSAKIQAKADAMVSESMVSGRVSVATSETDARIIATAAEQIATIRVTQREQIKRGKDLAMKLLEELEGQTDCQELFLKLGELMEAPDEKGIDRLRDLYQKVISTPGRVDSLKKLSDTLKTFISMEREAYGIGAETGNSGGSIDEFFKAVADRVRPLVTP